MNFTNYEGVPVAWYSSGDPTGAPVVLLHGFCEDSRVWQEWLSLLPGQRWYLSIDLPGFGNSGLLSELTIDRMAGAVAAVLGELRVEGCVVVGHSMGGYVALALEALYPGLMSGLCMFHSHPFPDSEEKQQGRLKSIDFIQRNGPLLFVRQMIPTLFGYSYSKGYQMEVNALIHHASFYQSEALIAGLHAMRQRPDRSVVLRNFQEPVLFFVGKQDSAIPRELSLQQLHLPARADIHILPSVGHAGMLEAPHATAKAFRAYLRMLDEAFPSENKKAI